MPFIGIISKETDYNYIKNQIKNYSEKKNYEFINININNIENIKNIRFDVIVINECIDDLFKKSFYIEKILNISKYILINMDVQHIIPILKQSGINVITYGLNSKATITVSSIKEENIMMCIQRSIKTKNNDFVEEQEINVKVCANNIDMVYNVLVLKTIMMIFGE